MNDLLRKCRRCRRSLPSSDYEGERKTCINCSNRVKMLRMEKKRKEEKKKESSFEIYNYVPWKDRVVCQRHLDYLKYPSRVNNTLVYRDGTCTTTTHGLNYDKEMR